MKNALIYSPGLDGHRQVHIFVMSHILVELGFKIFVATNIQQKTNNSFYIDKIKAQEEITIIDTHKYARGGLGITLSEFLELQNFCNTDLTIFAEADHHHSLFISQISGKKKRLKGRITGLFMRPFYYYRKGSFIKKLRLLKNLPSRWNKDDQLFYELFLKKFSLLDSPLSIDENFVNKNNHFTWIPDVFQQYANSVVRPDEKAEQRIWIEKLSKFKEKNASRFLFLYFGTAQHRRGFDTLLKLAHDTGGCFVHCGLKDSKAKFVYNTEELISSLDKENRYFETNEFIEDPLTIDFFFKSVSHLILPYKDFPGSSGVMLQALEYGIPVLAPDSAIIGFRINKYNLGMTFAESNMSSLISQFKLFKDTDPKTYEKDIINYMNLQSVGQLKNAYINSFTNAKIPVLIP